MLFSEATLPVDEQALHGLEIALGVRLPAGYRDFLCVANGGACRERGVRVVHPDKGSVTLPLQRFLGVHGERPDLDLWSNYRYYLDAQRMPSWLLPIAEDIGTNLIGIGLDAQTHAQIFYWDHEREFLPANGVFRIAGDFGEFLRGVHSIY